METLILTDKRNCECLLVSSSYNNYDTMSTVASASLQSKPTETPNNAVLNRITSSLRADNHSQLLEILALHPTDTDGAQSIHTTTGIVAKESSSRIPIAHKQRLVFGNRTIRTLLLRHVLLEPASSVDKAPAKAKRPKSTLSTEEESWGIDSNNPWGIVGTRVLLHTPCKDYDVAMQSRFKRASVGSLGNSAILDPSKKNAVFDSSTSTVALDHHNNNTLNDMQRDETDGAQVVVYFIRPDPVHIQAVAKSIRAQQNYSSIHNPTAPTSTTILKHRIVFIPHIHPLAHRLLQDEGLVSITTTQEIRPILTGLSIHVMPIDLIPLDSDLVTLTEHDGILKEVDIIGVSSDVVTMIAKSLVKLQECTGIIPRIQSWGVMGEKILEKMLQLQVDDYQTQEMFTPGETNPEGEEEPKPQLTQGRMYPTVSTNVAALVLLDRKIDWVTPMLTPLTYEGLLDDILGIDCGFIHVDSQVLDPPTDGIADPGTPAAIPSTSSSPILQSIPLNNHDSLYAEVRNQHVEKIGKFLQGQAKALKESHSTFTDKNKKDLSEIHQFVKQIPIFTKSVRLLTNHIHLAELIKKTTEQWDFRQRWQTERSMLESESCYDILDDLIALQYPPFRLLKLFCLQSLTSGGIKASRFDSLKRDIVQTYGFEFLFVLQSLEKMGLLKRKDSIFDSTSPFTSIRKSLNLILNDVDTSEPNDMAYVSSGYAPITVRLIQASMSGLSGKEEALRELPGRGIDIVQSFPPEDLVTVAKKGSPDQSLGAWAKRFSTKPVNNTVSQNAGMNKPLLLVFYIGGVTYMEIAALRFLSTSPSFPYCIMILTTKIIDGSSLLESLQYSSLL